MKNKINVKPNSSTINRTGGWRTLKPKFLIEKCNACGICVRFCPEGIIKKQIIKNKLFYNCDFNYCKGCGLCAAVCPVRAIVMESDLK